MPITTGALFRPLPALSVFRLTQIPSPTKGDEAEQAPRHLMGKEKHTTFGEKFALPFGLSLGAYLLLTAFRDFRDNYGVKLFSELGYDNTLVFSSSMERNVALGGMVVLASMLLVRDNRKTLGLMFAIMGGGLLLLGAATLRLDAGRINGIEARSLQVAHPLDLARRRTVPRPRRMAVFARRPVGRGAGPPEPAS